MVSASPGNITQLLLAWSQGNEGALERLTPFVYQELHRLAHSYMRRERPGHSLQTTALINEAYRKSQIVELRFFGGLGVEETAEVLKISRATVTRDWKLAKVWILRELKRETAT